MVKVAMPVKIAMATCLYAACASAESVNFINMCEDTTELYHSKGGSAVTKVAEIPSGGSTLLSVTGEANMFRTTFSPAATLVELSCKESFWIDISVIPVNPGSCSSHKECTKGREAGYNVAVSVVPKTNIGVGTCKALYCSKNDCADAYLFPADLKTHNCPLGTVLDVTFCYTSGVNVKASVTTNHGSEQQDLTNPIQQVLSPLENSTQQGLPEQDSLPVGGGSETEQTETNNVSEDTSKSQSQSGSSDVSSFGEVIKAYTYNNLGTAPGSYGCVVDPQKCMKEPVYVNRTMDLMCAPLSLIMRGPMEIDDIAVFTGPEWKKVSSYSRKNKSQVNLNFFNNMNPDYSGKANHSPQVYASSDGKSKAKEPTTFGGKLADATDPSKIGCGPGCATGAEVNILQDGKCKDNPGQCSGSHDGENHIGWSGCQKAFVMKVKMPNTTSINRPATWFLPTEVLYVGQYDKCNCRGMGQNGGCGELDVMECIETNPKNDMLSTHLYTYNLAESHPGGDNFFKRLDGWFVITVLFDNSQPNGFIKIIQSTEFDFGVEKLYDSSHQAMLNA